MPLLDTSTAKETFEQTLERVRIWYACYITGYVVMPEHIHLLISEPDRSKLSVAIQMLKQITSQKLHANHLPRFWQIRYYDFPVWSEAKRIEKLRYIHRNPVKRGLVQKQRTGNGAVSFTTRRAGKEPSRSNRHGPRASENKRGCPIPSESRLARLPHPSRAFAGGWALARSTTPIRSSLRPFCVADQQGHVLAHHYIAGK